MYPHFHHIKALSLKWTFPLYSHRKMFLSSYLKITASCELWTRVSFGILLLPQDISGSSISHSFSLFLSMCCCLQLSESSMFDPVITSNCPSSFFLLNPLSLKVLCRCLHFLIFHSWLNTGWHLLPNYIDMSFLERK